MDVFSDIDLLVIGSQDIISLEKKINRLEKETKREINAAHLSEAEFQAKKRKNNPFISRIMEDKKIKII